MICDLDKNNICRRCGHKAAKRVRRMCEWEAGESVAEPQHPLAACPHRGAVVATITGRVAGCDCSGSVVEVYQCSHFAEPVIKQGNPPCLDTLREQVKGATGRTCQACKVPMQTAAKPVQSVTVVITCHNYGRYLRQCLDSILAQSVRPETIVLVDDASSDDTPAIATEYAQQSVRYLRVEFHDVALSRNAGAAVCGKPSFYLFVDADNWLPPNYLETLIAGMQEPPCGVAYSRLDLMSDDGKPQGQLGCIQSFDRDKLRHGNFADTCALIRAQALDQSGGWRAGMVGFQDWDLWLRMTSTGWTMKLVEGTALKYRIHPGSMSEACFRRYEGIVRGSMLTTIVTLFCGRTWMLDRWFASLATLDWPRDHLHLVAVDNSGNAAFGCLLRDRLQRCGVQHTYVRDDRRVLAGVPSNEFTDSAPTRVANHREMGEHLGRLYATAGQYLPAATDLVWSIEDDVEFPPNALDRLSHELFLRDAGAVGGIMRNRFGKRALLARIDKTDIADNASGVQPVTITGFYCLLMHRDTWSSIPWRAGIDPHGKQPFYDHSACHDIRSRNRKIFVAMDVRCRHWQADGSAVDV